MKMQTILTIGLIASDLEISEKLSHLLGENGVILKHKFPLGELNSSHLDTVDLDIWLIDLAEDDWSDGIDKMLDEAKVPVLINEQQALFSQSHPEFWVQKLLVRLGELVLAEPNATSGVGSKNPIGTDTVVVKDFSRTTDVGVVDETQNETSLSENHYPVWVLAASLGGPAALKRFLQALPDGIQAGFILVQHIDHNFMPVLSKLLEDYSTLKVKLAETIGKVSIGEIVLAPVEQRLTMTPTGMLLKTETSWTPPYSPCIDDVLVDVAQHWDFSGAIVFSGMGGDGVLGAKAMHQASKPVWLQDSQSCANNAMPNEIEAAGYADYRGTPEQLAQQLVAYLHRQTMAAKTA